MKDSKKDIQISENQVRSGIAIVIALVGLVFMVGYYWGKKRAYEEFLHESYAASFGDKISASLCSLYDTGVVLSDEDTESDKEDLNKQESVQSTETLYFAELAGFVTLQKAQEYATRLAKRSIKSYVLEQRSSRTTRGKTRIITWYQVVTAPMDYDALQKLVDTIKETDHLRGVTLVEFTKKHKESFERSLS